MEELTFEGTDGIQLFARLFRVNAPKASLVIVHGFGDHSGRYIEMAEYLVKAGIAVLAYDQRGAGQSPGLRMHINEWSEYRDDLTLAQAFLSNIYPTTPVFLFGVSMGGAEVLEYVIMTDTLPRGVISSAPGLGTTTVSPMIVLIGKLFSGIAPKKHIKVGLDDENLSRIPDVVQAWLDDPLTQGKVTMRWGTEFMNAQKRILRSPKDFHCPLLLVYGDGDKTVPHQPIKEFYTNIAQVDKTLQIFPGGRHDLQHDLCKDEIFLLYRDWILARV